MGLDNKKRPKSRRPAWLILVFGAPKQQTFKKAIKTFAIVVWSMAGIGLLGWFWITGTSLDVLQFMGLALAIVYIGNRLARM